MVILGALVLTPGAQACSCAQMAPAKAMQQADAVIVGKLVRVVPRSRVKADYRYRVQRVYKRRAGIRRGRVISVRSARQSAACGLPHGVGRTFGLMLSRDGRRWTSGLCGVFRPRLFHSSRSFYRCDS
jgi:hypothetical protein